MRLLTTSEGLLLDHEDNREENMGGRVMELTVAELSILNGGTVGGLNINNQALDFLSALPNDTSRRVRGWMLMHGSRIIGLGKLHIEAQESEIKSIEKQAMYDGGCLEYVKVSVWPGFLVFDTTPKPVEVKGTEAMGIEG